MQLNFLNGILFSAGFLFQAGDAPREIRLSVERCVELALAENPELAALALSAEAGEAAIDEARGNFDPFFSGDLGFARNRRESSTSFSAGATSTTEFRNAGVGIGQNLWTGANYNLSLVADRTEFLQSQSGYALINPALSTALQLTVTQPLLRGAWTTYNTATIETAGMEHQQLEQSYAERVQETIDLVHAGFWDLLFVQKDVEVKRFALELGERLLEINQKKVKEGVSAPVEVLQAETEIAIRKEALITAENAVKTAEDSLKQLIFPFRENTGWDFVIVPDSTIPSVDSEEVPPWEKALDTAFQHRPDLHRQQIDLRIKELQVETAENATLPRLDFTGTTNYAGLDSQWAPSFDDIREQDFPSYRVGLHLEVPIGNIAAKGKLRAATANRDASKQTLQSLQSRIAREVRDAVRNLQFMKERIAATRKSRELAEKQLEAEERKFEVGLSTNFQVLQFQQDLSQALTNEKSALLEHAKARIRLKKVQGILLP